MSPAIHSEMPDRVGGCWRRQDRFSARVQNGRSPQQENGRLPLGFDIVPAQISVAVNNIPLVDAATRIGRTRKVKVRIKSSLFSMGSFAAFVLPKARTANVPRPPISQSQKSRDMLRILQHIPKFLGFMRKTAGFCMNAGASSPVVPPPPVALQHHISCCDAAKHSEAVCAMRLKGAEILWHQRETMLPQGQ
ncbi:hypothetical protein [Croceicoccus estronivorus]|uniref:hypothetical protein n=1 Tax=Croceicoccus estronivorus TaxID=1172626 RepID=UPI0014780903|nr:hypothetical protein [Croceicoccus estronivorus]